MSKALKIEKIDGNYLQWKKMNSGCYIQNYYDAYNIIVNSNNICNPSHRIGSESRYSLVYKLDFGELSTALKVIPIIASIDEETYNNELEITFKLSNLVLLGKCNNFPLLFFYGVCEDFTFPPNLKSPRMGGKHTLKDLTERYAIFKQIEEKVLNNDIKLVKNDIEILYNELLNKDDRDDYIDMYDLEKPKVKVNFMINELAIGDLNNWLDNTNYNALTIKEIITQIYHGIKCMHNEGITHNDLHLGNILVMNRCGYKFVITDFGKAKYDIDDKNKDLNKNLDLNHFLSLLIRKILSKIKDINLKKDAEKFYNTYVTNIIAELDKKYDKEQKIINMFSKVENKLLLDELKPFNENLSDISKIKDQLNNK